MNESVSVFTTAEALSMGLVVGVVIVAVLILAFVLGARRHDRELEPDWDPHSPERDAWATLPSTPGQAPHGDAAAPSHIFYTRP